MITRQGLRVYRDALDQRLDPRGRPYYWIGGEAPTGIDEEGTDVGSAAAGIRLHHPPAAGSDELQGHGCAEDSGSGDEGISTGGDRAGHTQLHATSKCSTLRRVFHAMNHFMVFMWKIGLGRLLNAGRRSAVASWSSSTAAARAARQYLTPVNYAIVDGEIYCIAGFGPTHRLVPQYHGGIPTCGCGCRRAGAVRVPRTSPNSPARRVAPAGHHRLRLRRSVVGCRSTQVLRRADLASHAGIIASCIS